MKKYSIDDLKNLATTSTPSGFKLFDPVIGKHAEYAFSQVTQKITDSKSAEEQFRKAYEVMSNSNPHDTSIGVKDSNQGLVIGNVQSGKTTSFATVASLAADNKYKLIINILGTTHTLKDSNYRDIEKLLGLEKPKVHGLDWHAVGVGFPQSRNSDYGIDVSIDMLLDMVNPDSGSILRPANQKVLYFYLLKNNKQIDKMTEILKFFSKNLKKSHEMPVMIIDDEVDSFSINIPKKKNGVLTDSPTYTSLKNMKEAATNQGGNVTYIGYTATAQAVLLSHSNSFLKPRFHTILEPGNGYVGNRELFGESEDVLTPQEISKGVNERSQPKVISILNSQGDKDDKMLSKELKKSVADFLISAVFLAARRSPGILSGQEADTGSLQEMSMMLLEDTQIVRHDHWYRELTTIIGSFKSATNPSRTTSISKKYLINSYKTKVQECDQTKVVPEFDACCKIINNLLNQNDYSIVKLNSEGPGTFDTSNKTLWFWIGGHKLGRGFVVPGLLTTWFPLEPKKLTIDVTEQRCRFYGYKKDYLDLISIYLQTETLELLQSYTNEEEDMHEDLKEMAKKGLSLEHFDPNWTVYGNFYNPTSPTKNQSKFSKYTASWTTSMYSPFDENNKAVVQSKDFHAVIDSFLPNIKTSVPSGNVWDANPNPNNARFFKYERFKLDQLFNKHFLDPLSKTINKKDTQLLSLIKSMQKSYLKRSPGENFYCDLIYFPNKGKQKNKFGISGLQIDKDHSNGWKWPNYGYSQGPNKNWRNSGYVGDDKIIIGDSFNPRMEPFNKNGNTTFTIQIHKIEIKHHDDALTTTKKYQLPRYVYTVRIMTPWSKKKSYFLAR